MPLHAARYAVALAVIAALAGGGCGAAPDDAPVQPAVAPANPEPTAVTPPAVTLGTRKVVFLGDSLTAGYGLPIEQAFPSLIATRLATRGWTIVNAGVSGDTSAGGLRRLEWSMEGGAAVVIVALGANDGLRGLPIDALERNLDAIVTKAIAGGATVILAGMEAPPNNGSEYATRFRRVYADVASRHPVTFVPFLLDGVAGIGSLNQADGIHPNKAGAERVADLVWRALDPVLHELERSRPE